MKRTCIHSQLHTVVVFYHYNHELSWIKKCVKAIRPTLSDFILGQEIPEDKLLYHS